MAGPGFGPLSAQRWKRFRSLALDAGFFGLAALVCVFAAVRLGYGVDLSDEGFYAAIPYRFALGDRPFVDELAIFQTSGLLVYPLVKIRLALVGSTEGLILYLRECYWVTAILLTVLSAIALSPLTGPALGTASAIALVAFVPFSIPTFSYNALACLFWTAGLCSSGRALIAPNGSRGWALVGALLITASVFCYPPLIVAALVWGVVVALARGRLGGVAWLLGSGLTVAVALIALVGTGALFEVFRYTTGSGVHGGGGDKLLGVLVGCWSQFPSFAFLAAGVGLVCLAKLGFEWLLLALPATYYFGYSAELRSLVPTSSFFVAYGAILGCGLAAADRAERRWSKLALFMGVPSVVAGLCFGWASTNGFLSSGIGMVPGFSLWIAHSASKLRRSGYGAAALLGTAAALFPLVHGQFTFFYRDGPRESMTEKIAFGPYAGLRTHPDKAQFVEALRKDVEVATKGKDTVVFHDDFPSGYLFSAARPGTRQLWITSMNFNPNEDRTPLIDYYSRSENLPDVVFEMAQFPQSQGQWRRFSSPSGVGDPIDPFRGFFLGKGYGVSLDGRDYRVLHRGGP